MTSERRALALLMLADRNFATFLDGLKALPEADLDMLYRIVSFPRPEEDVDPGVQALVRIPVRREKLRRSG